MNVDNIISTIRRDLTDVRNALTKWFRMDEITLSRKPTNGGWTALQILEHITLTNHFLLLIIDKASIKARKRALTNPIDQDWDHYELAPKLLTDIGVHKSFAWIRPEHMEPTGNVSLTDIEHRMNEQFDRCNTHLDLLKNGEGILCKTTMTVNGIGKLDVYQYVYFLVLHAKRHLGQMERI